MSPNKTPLWMQRWQQLGERDRRAIAWGATLLGLALLWWLALAPAIATLREAQARIATERATVQRLKDMAQEAQSLQSQARAPGEASALDRLRQASAGLGERAQITPQGDTLLVTLAAVTADEWTRWLAQVRLNAQLKPSQVRLRAAPDGTWSGTLVFAAGAP